MRYIYIPFPLIIGVKVVYILLSNTFMIIIHIAHNIITDVIRCGVPNELLFATTLATQVDVHGQHCRKTSKLRVHQMEQQLTMETKHKLFASIQFNTLQTVKVIDPNEAQC